MKNNLKNLFQNYNSEISQDLINSCNDRVKQIDDFKLRFPFHSEIDKLVNDQQFSWDEFTNTFLIEYTLDTRQFGMHAQLFNYEKSGATGFTINWGTGRLYIKCDPNEFIEKLNKFFELQFYA
jgi:hypothetical protein